MFYKNQALLKFWQTVWSIVSIRKKSLCIGEFLFTLNIFLLDKMLFSPLKSVVAEILFKTIQSLLRSLYIECHNCLFWFYFFMIFVWTEFLLQRDASRCRSRISILTRTSTTRETWSTSAASGTCSWCLSHPRCTRWTCYPSRTGSHRGWWPSPSRPSTANTCTTTGTKLKAFNSSKTFNNHFNMCSVFAVFLIRQGAFFKCSFAVK